jgi:hypothetical protein
MTEHLTHTKYNKEREITKIFLVVFIGWVVGGSWVRNFHCRKFSRVSPLPLKRNIELILSKKMNESNTRMIGTHVFWDGIC